MNTSKGAWPAFPHLLHGADYSPEQWENYDGIWDEDFRMMKLAGCNVMNIGIFSWTRYEKEDGVYDFAWMDEIMDRLAAQGMKAVLATPSGAKPHWMALKYPEIRRVDARGRREDSCGRHNFCPTSPLFRSKAVEINTKLAERYKNHPALLVWHVSNEYGGCCYCELCRQAFRDWLKLRYKDLETLNHAWWSDFWSHRFLSWDEIILVDAAVHGMVVDWKRFANEQMLDFFKAESAPLIKITPDVPVTVNMMGTYEDLDYWKWAPHVDVISWDNYPQWHTQKEELHTASFAAMCHDINRSLKQGQSFMLMESTPSNTNWMPICRPKRPGMHRLSSLQAIAHGSDTVQYFQWRKGRGGSEKFHGAVVDHAGHEQTRVFRDVAQLGEDLQKIKLILGARTDAKVALVFDWESRWALNASYGPRNTNKDYSETCHDHYHSLWTMGLAVDVINTEQDLSKYDLVIAPMLYMVSLDFAEKVKTWVNNGGTYVTTYLSSQVNESDLCHLGGFPGPLRPMLGIWVEETDVFTDHQQQKVIAGGGGLSGEYAVKHYADVIHAEGAEVLATYGDDFYVGQPALTKNAYGKGHAYYIGSRNESRF